MASQGFFEKNRTLLIFVAMLIVLVLGERFLGRSSEAPEEIAAATQEDRQRSAETDERVFATVQAEDRLPFSEDEFDAANLALLEPIARSEAVKAANATAQAPNSEAQGTFIADSSSRLVAFGAQVLGVIEIKLVTQDPQLAAEPAHVLRIYGFADGKPLSVSCVRSSGKPVSMSAGDCGLRLAEVFGLQQ